MAAFTKGISGRVGFSSTVRHNINVSKFNSLPVRVTAAATFIGNSSQERHIQGLQWVDDDLADHGKITAGDNLIIILNGVTIQLNAVAASSMPWELMLFRPVVVDSLVINTIEGGALLIYLA